jgi:transcriptional regulator with XRE-family HTH domain
MQPAELVRSTRERLGLSQRRLALRAGTTQAQVSRIERGEISPTFDTIRQLMLSMGEEVSLQPRRTPACSRAQRCGSSPHATETSMCSTTRPVPERTRSCAIEPSQFGLVGTRHRSSVATT